MLRKIVIGMPGLHYEGNDFYEDDAGYRDLYKITQSSLDLWAIVQAVWSSEISVEISFQGQLSDLGDRDIENYRGMSNWIVYDFAALGKVIQAIIQDDLHIRKYARLISRIYVDNEAKNGVVLFVSTNKHVCDEDSNAAGRRYHTCMDHPRYFSIKTEKDIQIKWRPPTLLNLPSHLRPPTLLNMPSHLRNGIFWLVLRPDGNGQVDVDKTSPSAIVAPALRLVSKQLYEDLDLKYFCWDCPLVLTTTIDCYKSSYTNFTALRRWLSAGAGHLFPYRGRIIKLIEGTLDLKIRLNVQVPGKSAPNDLLGPNSSIELKMLRLDIRELILITAHHTAVMARHYEQDHRRITIELAICKADDNGTSDIQVKHVFALSDLRTNVLRALACLVAIHGLKKNDACPQIFINGYGEVVGYSYEPTYSAHGEILPLSICDTGFDWNPALGEHEGPFDGSMACYINYLWRVFTGGSPDLSAEMVFFSGKLESKELESEELESG